MRVSHCIAILRHLIGSLVGSLLPRMMLHERGVPASLVKFGKTESNKPYICMVSGIRSVLPAQGATSVAADELLL